MQPSKYIRAPHPKTNIRPTVEAIKGALKHGWVAQKKIHGHRAQIHVPATPDNPLLIFNRQGKLHKRPILPALGRELRRIFTPAQAWNVIDGEWIKRDGGNDHIYVFDFLRREGTLLTDCTFPDRFALLPRVFGSEMVTTLPILTTVSDCMTVLAEEEEQIEGLIFRSTTTKGFSDTSIIRCRKGTTLYQG